ncbi:nuclear transport factor 2 family protein [Ornithinimicrobium avium]|uniref:Nuclear transport factor 2 family protein n=1 Tax=Ornithinimicrobium avium TaxID=2283195 RepID=A0A345NSU4_9MICO|nr:nuclear transport factor 2 family protein [Ornithinimicrobium avium]AXH98102.1 nuclear transport factor 2 family protein [Ornithinimicrobium avium]
MEELGLETLLSLERRGWDALCSSSGGRFYGELMSEDAVMVLVNGAVLDRDAVVASLDEAPAWDSYELTAPRLVPVTAESAAVVYRAVARRGDEPPFEALMASVYARTDDGLRLVLYQQTTTTH